MKHRLLMIDDNLEDIGQVRRFLDAHIYTVVACTDPLEAVDEARNFPPDLIILDIQMEPLDGFGVIGRLHQHPETRDIPVIIYSIVGDEDETILRSLGLGADHIVYKGRSMQILEAAIKRELSKTGSPTIHTFRVNGHELKIKEKAERVWLNDEELMLTRCQRLILSRLIEFSGTPISAEDVLDYIGKDCRDEEHFIATSGYAYKFIHDLRDRIEPDPGNPVFLTSQRELGYRLSSNGRT